MGFLHHNESLAIYDNHKEYKMGIFSLPVLALIAIVGVVIKAVLYFTAKSKNPFEEPIRTPVKPKVTDQKTRDAVLKQGFSEDKVPANLDAIVVGSGIGGMSTAAIMAKAGKRVLVLEQHDQHFLFSPDETYDEVIFAEPEKPVRKYPVRSGKGNWASDLKKRFPLEEANIDKWLCKCIATEESISRPCFSEDKVPANLDAIVVGSGIGGMSTAAIMAKAGKRVLVLEQHDQIFFLTFKPKHFLFSPDETYDEVIFAEPEKPVRKYPVRSGKGNWASDLKKRFPLEEANIDKFFALLEEIREGNSKSILVKVLPLWLVWFLNTTGLLSYITDFYDWNAKSCREVVYGITENQELRDIFCYCFGDFGTPPSKAGFPMQTLLHTHFQKGAAYPIGGASEIAFHIIPVIEAAGGRVLVRAEVTQILLGHKGAVCGVQVKKGKEIYNIQAPVVISAAGLYNTYERLLPLDIASSSRIWPVLQDLEHGPGAMSVFVGLDCSAEELDIIHKKNAWVFTGNDIDKLTLNYLNLTREEALDVDIPLLFISFPSTKDPEWDKKYKGKTTMAIVTLMPYHWLEQWKDERVMKRGDDYEGIKKIFGHKAVEQACQLFPSIRDHIDYVNIGTPLSNQHYLGAPRGEIYGLDHTRERFSAWANAVLRPKTDIPGLFISGQDICSCGFSGALWGGILSASAALERNVFNDLADVHKRGKALKKSN
ncbi:all-trans-retinol 13,14-reductase-like [Penaeus indicus]|uniref:all-trans-retinol 13,14-reductase-like n=1 Tax=Penaeus indicus TaxID=29960 RepID=UPI00300C5393